MREGDRHACERETGVPARPRRARKGGLPARPRRAKKAALETLARQLTFAPPPPFPASLTAALEPLQGGDRVAERLVGYLLRMGNEMTDSHCRAPGSHRCNSHRLCVRAVLLLAEPATHKHIPPLARQIRARKEAPSAGLEAFPRPRRARKEALQRISLPWLGQSVPGRKPRGGVVDGLSTHQHTPLR